MSAMPETPAAQIGASLARTIERCQEVEHLAGELATLAEVLENELVALAEEAGRLNTALAPHRQVGGGA
jgi:hypothetical protein